MAVLSLFMGYKPLEATRYVCNFVDNLVIEGNQDLE